MGKSHAVVESPRVPRRGPYSQAVRLGELIFVAGQAGLNPATGAVVGTTFELQARQAFENLRAVLEDAGSGLDRVVKTTCFLAVPEAFDQLNALYAEYSRWPRRRGLRRSFNSHAGCCFQSRRLRPWGRTAAPPNQRLEADRSAGPRWTAEFGTRGLVAGSRTASRRAHRVHRAASTARDSCPAPPPRTGRGPAAISMQLQVA